MPLTEFDQLPLAANDRAAVLEAAECLAALLPVERVVLYGSKARGDDRPDSDIDLLILTSRPLTVAEGFQVTNLLRPAGGTTREVGVDRAFCAGCGDWSNRLRGSSS